MRHVSLHAVSLAVLALASYPALSQDGAGSAACPGGDAGLSLPRGFCATIFADEIGHARHMAIGPNGVVYVNTWSGRYYGTDRPPAGGFIVALRDDNGDGRAETVKRFGATPVGGGAGGTGIALYDGGLYVEESDKILRYSLSENDIVPSEKPQTVVSGMPLTGDHPMHPFAIDARGNLYLNSASATNSCQVQNRIRESPGLDPCRELETRAGVWRYDAKATGQKFSPAERFATGIRNGEGIAIDGERVYVTQHGRDQLSENWPKLYTREQGPELPAEELVELQQGADYGWPYCYYDSFVGALVLAPEYGGDGGKTIGVCAQKQGPLVAFPAHWAPNDLAIYRGGRFPSAYDGGFFLAFHGSWNRAPFPQGGYNVVFQPMANGRPKGDFVVFADGFAGKNKEPGGARHRPSGLAIGPDGALYVSDDVSGRIWRITFHGDIASTGVEPAPDGRADLWARSGSQAAGGRRIQRPAKWRDASCRRLPASPTRRLREASGFSTAMRRAAPARAAMAKTARVHPSRQISPAGIGCGATAVSTPSARSSTRACRNRSSSEAPCRQGAARSLSDADIDAVAAYVWAISRTEKK